jgi:hypothetical protein
MEPTILGIVSTNLELGKMAILISSPSRVPCQGNMLLVLVRLQIPQAEAISRILPECVVASRAMLKMPELDNAVAQLPMSWVDPGGLDTKAWSI